MDKCGYDEAISRQLQIQSGLDWGYGYNDLLADLQLWAQNPRISVDSLGVSVQNRAIWQLTITSEGPPVEPRRTVFMHARTHPNEAQGWWVANEFINLLISDEPYAAFLREKCIFYIIPMYNPDGVELGYPRQNANGIDIESNWNANPVEPEVAVLRNRFEELMSSDYPIEIALNMHSAYGTDLRYFVYHDASGTSAGYAQLEQSFISGIRSYFSSGVAPWDYFISWVNYTPAYYPESWFWINHGENVMALTYEDINSPGSGMYDSTAFAILHGIGDYLGLYLNINTEEFQLTTINFKLEQNFPNPFNPLTTIKYRLYRDGQVRLIVYNLEGQTVRILVDEQRRAGEHRVVWDGKNQMGKDVVSGVYIYQISTNNQSAGKKMVILR